MTSVKAIAVAVLVVFFTFQPFLPGPHDPNAATFSMMAQVLGAAGLLFVPLGLLWLTLGNRQGYVFETAALCIVACLCALVSLCALAASGASLAIITLAASTALVWRLLSALLRLRGGGKKLSRDVPLYLILTPAAIFAAQWFLGERAAEFSRARAIRNTAPLISAIEEYRLRHGRYPPSLLSVWADYRACVIGIARYHYEPAGDAYNVLFEQHTLRFGTREFVVYNKLGEHAATSHDMDLLEHTGRDLDLRRGYYAANHAPQQGWKYFWFD